MIYITWILLSVVQEQDFEQGYQTAPTLNQFLLQE
jgi:hypothetical protein